MAAALSIKQILGKGVSAMRYSPHTTPKPVGKRPRYGASDDKAIMTDMVKALPALDRRRLRRVFINNFLRWCHLSNRPKTCEWNSQSDRYRMLPCLSNVSIQRGSGLMPLFRPFNLSSV